MNHPKTYPRALTVAGSDSGGGAGVQADLKTFAAHGCYGMSVITALTAQNTLGVRAVHPVPADMVLAQMEAVLTDIGADAVKIGMLFSPELIRAVGRGLDAWAKDIPVVLDPVMIAQSGDSLITDDAAAVLKTELLPRAALITPNLPEAARLLGHPVHRENMEDAARELTGLGCPNALLKGGHLSEGDSVDILALADGRLLRLSAPRMDTKNNHGTGCTLSSAIAANLALGLPLEEAVAAAKRYLSAALAAGARYTIGGGHGPVHHLHALFPERHP